MTIDIPDHVLRRAMLATGTKSPQEAVLKVLEGFVSLHNQSAVIPLLGTLDDFMTQEKLEEMRTME